LNYGASYEIVEYLQQHNPEQRPIYMMNHHLAYWLMDLKPLSKVVTHPSNIAKDYLLKYIEGAEVSTIAELNKILAKKPKFIIREEEPSYIEKQPQANQLLKQVLVTKYELVKQIEDLQIYQIRSSKH
jgi:hypothetical protein